MHKDVAKTEWEHTKNSYAYRMQTWYNHSNIVKHTLVNNSNNNNNNNNNDKVTFQSKADHPRMCVFGDIELNLATLRCKRIHC